MQWNSGRAIECDLVLMIALVSGIGGAASRPLKVGRIIFCGDPAGSHSRAPSSTCQLTGLRTSFLTIWGAFVRV